MGYLKVSRELLNSSFWRSLAPAEKGILIDLMAMAAYKPTSINLYGISVKLNIAEVCFSTKILAGKWDISVHVFRKIIEKLTRNNLVVKKRRQIGDTGNNTGDNTRRAKNNNPFFLSLTFNRWAFEDNSDNEVSSQETTPEMIPDFSAEPEHNKEVINKEVLNESTRRNSACAVPVSNGSKDKVHRKPWYTMEQIAKMELPYAEEILKEWTEYSSRSKNDVLALLQKFTKNQRLFGLPEMTLDVFNKEFRKEMKSAFALKSKYKNEPERNLYYYGEDD